MTGSVHPDRLRQLAPNQLGLYLADSRAGSTGIHNVSVVYRLSGRYDRDLLVQRFERLVQDHFVLAERVVEVDGRPMSAPARPPRLHVEQLPIPADTTYGRRRLRRECRRPINLQAGPLVRALLLCYSDGQADLVLVAHHLAVDERSVEVIVERLLADRPGGAAGDYPAWVDGQQRAAEAADDKAQRLRDELASADLSCDLDWGCGDGGAAPGDGGRVALSVAADTWSRLTATARTLRITPYSALLGAVGLVLSRNSGVGAPVVGASVSRRPVRERDTVGYFSATVLVPVRPEDELTVAAYLQQVHGRCVQAYRDSDVPLTGLLPARAMGGTPVPQAVVVPCSRLPEVHTPSLDAVPHPDPDLGYAQFPLTCYAYFDQEQGLDGFIQFQHAWFTSATAALFGRQVDAVLAEFADGPERALGAVRSLSADDQAAVLTGSRGERVEARNADRLEAAPATVPELFARQVRRDPGRIAVTDGTSAVSYAELDVRSSSLARALVEAGVTPGHRVGVSLGRSCELVVALLAVLKAGGVYVPLDSGYPEERLAFITADAGLSLVVGRQADEPLAGPRVLPPDAVPSDPAAPLPPLTEDSTAYLIHTSGSTGRPKGVLVTHRNVAALLAATQGELGLGPDDVWTLFHSFAFDFSVWEIWGCLLTGGRLVVVPYWTSRNPQEFHALLAAEAVTVLSQTPTAFTQLVAVDGEATGRLSVRLLVFGGEPLETRTLLPWFDRYPTARVENMYGITETTVHCTRHTVTRADALAGSRSVGRPLPGWDLYVLDDAGRPVPPGVAGEIHVGGAGVALGYLNRAELTAERFTEDHFSGAPGARLYRSGDRGRYLPDGRLEHLGRLDDQVKIRGFRIELGEVTNVLLEDPEVLAAAVVVHGPGTAAARLDAYVVTTPGTDPRAVRRRAGERLPGHMVPATVTPLPELPLTGNGKLDARALPEPLLPAAGVAVGAAPETAADVPSAPGEGLDPVTAKLVAIWAQVLGTPVQADANFFDLGGNSLLAVRLNAALREVGFPPLQLREIFRHSTLPRMAELIRSRHDTAQEASS
ncbi:amino acid adenylation domain-containing protein [Kitasatospora aureofaciens]|uniref:non-ribosomal peptide synthetase n=1 Tax=Kitasatospora aureofaciens TaxID=1894 RepID=UPI00382C2C39